jgi:hypothetical protein
VQSLVVATGAHNRLCPSLARRLYHRLTSTANARRFVPVPDLAVALVDAVEVAPTHPELLQGGLPTPTSTMLARATSPCCSVVSSPTPASTTPHPPSLHPFTFDDGTIHSSEGGNAHPFCAQGLSLPPWKRTRRKYRPNHTCRRHQPCAPNQFTGWA